MDKGFTPAQIRTALMSANWPPVSIDKVLEKFTSEHVEQHADKEGVTKPNGDLDSLKDYVMKELNEGHTPQQIKKVLKSAGWSDESIKKALKF